MRYVRLGLISVVVLAVIGLARVNGSTDTKQTKIQLTEQQAGRFPLATTSGASTVDSVWYCAAGQVRGRLESTHDVIKDAVSPLEPRYEDLAGGDVGGHLAISARQTRLRSRPRSSLVRPRSSIGSPRLRASINSPAPVVSPRNGISPTRTPKRTGRLAFSSLTRCR